MRARISTCYVLLTIGFLPLVYAADVQTQIIHNGSETIQINLPKNDYDPTPIIISAILAGGVFGGFVLNARASKKQTKANYLKIIREYQEKFEKLQDSESKLITKTDCDSYAFNFINILDSMVYAQSKNWIPQEILDYFKPGELSYGKTLFDWNDKYAKTDEERAQFKSAWTEFYNWSEKANIEKLDPKVFLPDALQNYENLPEIGQQNYQEIRGFHENQVRLMVSDKELLKCFKHIKIPKKYLRKDLELNDLSIIERKLFAFFMLEFDLYERVFLAYNAGIINDYEWGLWLEWFKIFKDNWIFKYCFKRVSNVFEPKLMNAIGKEIFNYREEDMEKIRADYKSK